MDVVEERCAGIDLSKSLTRYRTETTRDRVRDVNRLAMFLEDAGIKLSSVVSDITGRSARAMLDALVAGERDPQVLADLALGSLQGKVPLLARALTGSFSEHHAFMVAAMLRAIDEADARIARLSEEINRQLLPLRAQVELLITIPGISLTLAQILIAEVGVDMGRFATAGHLASWAGMCPGNKESAGKRLSGRTRHGDTWLKTALFMAGATAARSKGTYLGAQYRRLVPTAAPNGPPSRSATRSWSPPGTSCATSSPTKTLVPITSPTGWARNATPAA